MFLHLLSWVLRLPFRGYGAAVVVFCVKIMVCWIVVSFMMGEGNNSVMLVMERVGDVGWNRREKILD